MSESESTAEGGIPQRGESTAYKVADAWAVGKVAAELTRQPDINRVERSENIKKLVELERSAITGFHSLRDAATEENFNNPDAPMIFPHVDTSEECRGVRNALAKSAWDEFSQAYPDQVEVYQAYSDAQGEASRLIAENPEVQGMLQRFEAEHPEAHNISIKLGMSARDRFNNVLPADQRWWPNEVSKDEASDAEALTSRVKTSDSQDV